MTRASAFMSVGIGFCVLGAGSCGPRNREAQPAQLTGDPAAVHAVHSAKLHTRMSKLGSRSSRTWPQEIASERAEEAKEARAERFDAARRLAAALSAAAEEIPEAISGVQMAPADRERFLAQVKQLHDQAEGLEGCAARQDFDGMRAALQSIRATCNECHSQFRGVTGAIRLPKSAI